MTSSRVQALAGLVVILSIAAVSLWVARPVMPRPADAPDSEFSAARAMRHVEALAAQPHPGGTRAHARARTGVVNELRRLGWRVEVDDTWTHKWRGDLLRLARLSNVVARHPAATGPPRVLLASHYDSVPSGPGAGDASAPVAAILEALRALDADPAARDLGVLITDGEEAGLLGAKAFAEQHPWMQSVEVVLNFEARGNAGVPWMFETGYGAARLVGTFGRSVPRPFANSLSTAIYRRMPNDTDYSVFRDRNVQGLNVAMIGNHPAYHSQLDTPAHLDQRSLQSMGDAVLGLARAVPSSDWRHSSTETTYFNPFGSWFVRYPVQLDQAVLVMGIFLGGLWLWGRVDGLLPGIVFALGAWAAVSVVVGLSWWILITVFPSVIDAPNRVPYDQALLHVGWLLMALAVTGQFAGWLRKDTQAAATGLVMLAAVGALSVAKFPESTYMVAWPLLTLAIAAWLTVVDPTRRWLWWTLGALPVPLLYAPLAREALLGLTPHGAWMVAAGVGLGIFPLLPLLREFGKTDQTWRLTLAGLGAVLVLACGVTAGAGADTPRPFRLAYLAPPTGDAHWISRSQELDPWLSEVVGGEWIESEWNLRPVDDVGDLYAPPLKRAWIAGAPRPAGLTGPEIRHLATGSDEDGRWLDVEFVPARGGQQLWLELSGAAVDKVQWRSAGGPQIDDQEVRRLLVLAPGRSETLRLWARGTTPVWITAWESTYGLPTIVPDLPDYLIRSRSWTDFAVSVASRAAVDDRHTDVAADS